MIPASPVAPFERVIQPPAEGDDRLRIFVHARLGMLAAAPAQQHRRLAEGLAAVVRAADEQIAVFGGAGEHEHALPLQKQLAPETGEQLTLIVPGLAVVVRAENERQVLRVVARKKIHRRQQSAVGQTQKRGTAKKAAGKAIGVVLGMQIVDRRAERRPAAGKAGAALFAVRLDEKGILGARFQPRDAKGRFCRFADRLRRFAAPRTADRIGRSACGQPKEGDAVRVGHDAADVDVAHLKERRTVGRIAPRLMCFHRNSSFPAAAARVSICSTVSFWYGVSSFSSALRATVFIGTPCAFRCHFAVQG